MASAITAITRQVVVAHSILAVTKRFSVVVSEHAHEDHLGNSYQSVPIRVKPSTLIRVLGISETNLVLGALAV
jgi:hypothetical protein